MDRSPSRRDALRFTAVALCTFARAQEPTFSTGVDVVNVLVTVRDKEGRLVKGLAKDDFVLEQDGRVQPIRYFSPQAGQPLTLALLIDASGSQRSVMGEQRRAGREFLNKILRKDDRAFLVRFDRAPELLPGLDFPEPQSHDASAQGTALYDAIAFASSRIQAHAGRKALVVLSDGYDTSSSATLTAAIEAAQRADALIYTIRFLDREVFKFEIPVSQGGSPVPREGRKALERISRETGGAYFDLTAAENLDRIYTRIEDELRNQYSLGFTPAGGRAGYRKIRVSVKRKGMTAAARDGYYSTE